MDGVALQPHWPHQPRVPAPSLCAVAVVCRAQQQQQAKIAAAVSVPALLAASPALALVSTAADQRGRPLACRAVSRQSW